MLRLTCHFLLSRFILIYFAQRPREQAMCDEVIIAIVIITIVIITHGHALSLVRLWAGWLCEALLGGRTTWVWRLTHYTLGGGVWAQGWAGTG